MASGFLLKPWFPITCGHKGAVLEQDPEFDSAEEQKNQPNKGEPNKTRLKV